MRAEVLASVLTLLQLQSLVRGFDSSNSSKISPKETGRRVLYGEEADPDSLPFLVFLQNGNMFCSGSIIDDHWVMTAAHCVHQTPCKSIELHPAVSIQEKIYPIECHVHPEFVLERFRHDISLLKVWEDLVVGNQRAQLIALPGPSWDYPPGKAATVVGWGMKEDGSYPGRQLLKATVQVEDWGDCNREWKRRDAACAYNSTCKDIARRAVCTKGQGPNPAGTCVGDSGGPLIIDRLVMGVASVVLREKSYQCAIGSPSLFVSVVDYLPWIYSYIEPDLDTSYMQVKPEH